MIEINPLVVTEAGKCLALDGKMSFDDNALFRHPDIAELRDETEEDPAELEAKETGLSYIKLDGNIGCMVNGAGLAMATMDIIKHFGGEPANFLDVGGGANAEQVAAAIRIITADRMSRAIFVNIFGGIMRCDTSRRDHRRRPTGGALGADGGPAGGHQRRTGQADAGESGLNLATAADMKDGAQKIVELAN